MRIDAERDVRIRPDAQPVIEIEHHCRALRGRHQQVLEFSQHVRADGVALIAGEQISVGALVDEHVEVVEPEVGHHFVELPFAIDGSQYLGLHQLLDHHLLGILERHHRFFLLRAHARHQRICLGAFTAGGDLLAVLGRHFQNFFHALVGRQIEKFLRLEIREPAFFAALGLARVGGLGTVGRDGASPVSTGGAGSIRRIAVRHGADCGRVGRCRRCSCVPACLRSAGVALRKSRVCWDRAAAMLSRRRSA